MAATMRLALAFLSSSLFALTYGETIGPVTDLHIVNKIIAPDGFNRSTVLAGGKADTAAMPGPLIVGDKGSQFRINLVNSLEDRSMLTTTAIHWHGLFQAGTSWADGPVGVNQCPIVPGNSFLYQFDAAGQAGTFWYHSHHSTQYCDGLRGPLVIYDPQDPHKSKYDIDDESTVITLADWYHLPAPAGARFPQPNSTLINGLGRFIGGPNTPLAVMNVKPKKRYRMRLVNIACFPNFNFSIDNHNMTIIEADGVSTNPLTVDSIQIFVAQRYSFVLTANQPVNNYWIRSLPNLPPLAGAGFANGVNSAILRYAGAPNTDPTTSQTPSVIPLLESNLSPLTDPQAPGKPVPGGADINLNLNITFDPAVQRYSVNGASFETPPLPVLLQILSGARTPQELLPAGSVFVFPPGKSVEVSIPGGAPGGPHPFHLHGQVFDVVRSAGSTTYNFANPVKRDVVSIGVGGDNVTFRFSTDNPGPWFLHCHIDWHLEVGLAVVFVTDSDATAQTFTPQAWNDLCPAYNASGLP